MSTSATSPPRRSRREAPRSTASASTPATRRTSRSPARSTSSGFRPRRWSRSRPTTGSGSMPRPSPRPSPVTGPPACAPSPSPRSRARPTRDRSTSCRSSRTLAAREGLWLHVDAAYGGAARLSQRDRDRVPGLHLADSVTIDPHKWFFQAYDVGALVVRDGRHLRDTFDRSPEYYRGGEAAVGTADDAARPGAMTRTPASSTSTSSASRAPAASARSSCGRRWKHLGTSGLGRLIEANDDVAAYLARRCAEADDLEALPEDPELSVVCFRHLPGGAAAARRMATRRPRRPPGPPGRRARAIGRRVAVDDVAPRIARGCAPAS